VVLAIVGLIVAVSTPSVSAGIDSVRMASASDSIAAFLNSAVNYAERHQQPVLVTITVKENKLEAYSNDNGLQRELKLPDGIDLQGEDVRLILLPGATTPGLSIQIANRRGGRRAVRLDPMTGFPHVESVEQK